MKMSSFFALLLAISMALNITPITSIHAADSAPPALEAEAAILIDQVTGKILYEKNADKQLYPASTTKILTALLAVEEGNLEDIITVGIEAMMVPVGSSIAGLSVGDQISLGDLVYGLMLPSGNDAAYSIAVYLGRKYTGDQDLSASAALSVFADRMNTRARELGAHNSNFTVPDGFHDADHYTTAHDLALISLAALEHEFLRQVVSTGRYVSETWVGPHSRPWGNTNQLVRTNDKFYFPDATGLKTGYTRQANFCLASSGSRGDLNLIAIVLNTSKDGRWTDSADLMEYGFDNFAWLQLVEEGEIIQTVGIRGQDIHQPERIDLVAAQGFGTVLPPDELGKVEKQVLIEDGTGPAELTVNHTPGLPAPLDKGQVVGELVFTLNGTELFRTDLISNEDVAAMPWWRRYILPGGLTLGLGLISSLAVSLRRKKRYRKYRYTSKRIGY